MMKNSMKKLLSFVLCIVLIAAMALCTTGCNDNQQAGGDTSAVTFTDGQALGQGATKFTFTVVDLDGNEVSAEVSTDKTTVGEALVELGVIAGDDSEYGLYVKTVNGTTLDYDKDGKYWAFYVDGEYAMTGVDSTEITAGSTYTFKAE